MKISTRQVSGRSEATTVLIILWRHMSGTTSTRLLMWSHISNQETQLVHFIHDRPTWRPRAQSDRETGKCLNNLHLRTRRTWTLPRQTHYLTVCEKRKINSWICPLIQIHAVEGLRGLRGFPARYLQRKRNDRSTRDILQRLAAAAGDFLPVAPSNTWLVICCHEGPSSAGQQRANVTQSSVSL